MNQFIEFIPLVLFLITYKITPHSVEIAGFTYQLGGIFSAVQILIVSSVIAYGFIFIKEKRLEKKQAFLLIATIVFGGLSVYFHEEAIIKWKAPIVNWIFALVYVINFMVNDKTISERLLHQVFDMPALLWKKLDLAWIVFFTFIGFANLFVAFTYPKYWVDFRVFGGMTFMIIFIVSQFLLLKKYIKLNADGTNKSNHHV